MINIFTIIIFIFIVISIGIYSYAKSRKINLKASSGYFMGGYSLNSWTIAFTIIMTNLSTEQIVGQSGQSYISGMEVMAWEVTSAITLVLLSLVFLPKYFKYGVDTISEFIEIRYDQYIKNIVSCLFIFTYTFSFLPVVLYSGALVFNKIFSISDIFNISDETSIILIAFFIGSIAIIYLMIGGLALGAYSDLIYGVGLLIIGLVIPTLGLGWIGNGEILQGFNTVIKATPEKLNAFGSLKSEFVPWPAIFLGIFFNNLFFWCTNQMIIQKALAGRNLREAQKGTLYVGFFKIFSGLFLVFPGVIVYNIFGKSLENPDDAYPILINTVLPDWTFGIFGAVIFGAILSSFVGALNSSVTLFLTSFQKANKKNIIDIKILKRGKIATIIIGIVAIALAPIISIFPKGLYTVIQEFNGIYNIPVLIIIVSGIFMKKTSNYGVKVMFISHIIIYLLSKLLLTSVNYLYILSGLFFIDWIIIMIFNNYHSSSVFNSQSSIKRDIKPWKYRYILSVIIVVLVVLIYIVFSPIGIAK